MALSSLMGPTPVPLVCYYRDGIVGLVYTEASIRSVARTCPWAAEEAALVVGVVDLIQNIMILLINM